MDGMDRLLTEPEKRELISAFIGEILTTRGVSRKELATVADVSQPTISSWENKKITASLERVARLAEYYGLQDSANLRALGLTSGQPYQFKRIGPYVEKLDKLLESTDDPGDQQIAIDQLIDDINSITNLLEALNQRRRK